MAERKSQNKYYPPDWDPSKGSVNKYVGQHPLRDRARKLSQGILIIRFEMPYNIWCDGCNNHIGMGVRYNAEKTKTGMYYTTPIYKFRMKCHLCPNHFEIQTDPKNHDYVILTGARRKEQRWDPKENEQIVPEDRATHKKMATDAMFKLEHGSDDLKKSKAVVMTLSNLEDRRDEWKDDYILNKIARQKFREAKNTLKSAEASDAALLSKSSLEIPLVKEREQDKKLAKLMKYRTVQSFDEKQAQKRKEIESRPIFQPSKVRKLDISSPDKKKLNIIKKHLQNIGNKKSSPFNAGREKSSSKSSLDQLSLGIKRKSSNASNEVANEVANEVDIESDLSSEINPTNTLFFGTEGATQIETDGTSTEIQNENGDSNICDITDMSKMNDTLDDTLNNKVSHLKSNAGSEIIARITDCSMEDEAKHTNIGLPISNKLDINTAKLEIKESQYFEDKKHQVAKEKAFSETLITLCESDLQSEVHKTSISHLEEIVKKVDTSCNNRNIDEKDPELEHVCDTKVENLETFCDIKPKFESAVEDKKSETEWGEERDNKTNVEQKVDRKNLSLVSSYSDTESDSCNESS